MACDSIVMALWEIGFEKKKACRLLKNAQQQKTNNVSILLMEIRGKKRDFTTGVCWRFTPWQYFMKDLKDYPSEQTEMAFLFSNSTMA